MDDRKQHQIERQSSWRKQNTTRREIQFNNINDQDILKWLDSKGRDAAGYIRKLIRDDIKRSQE